MKLQCFKTLWGIEDTVAAIRETANPFDGVEGALPDDDNTRTEFLMALQQSSLTYIAEVATTGTYVPDRRLPPTAHLEYLEQRLSWLQEFNPLFVTCLGGCDAWTLDTSLAFLQSAMALGKQYDTDISFETHRGRILFNPWVTQQIVNALPEIKLTFDLSHWCVVCEGIQETEELIILELAKNTHHIHARVGYDQGPQVPDPFIGRYTTETEKHLKWWGWFWASQRERGFQSSTLTPEFGPDGYDYRDLGGDKTLVDIAEINRLMAVRCREEFE